MTVRLRQPVRGYDGQFLAEVEVIADHREIGLHPYEVDQLVAAVARRAAKLREPDWWTHG